MSLTLFGWADFRSTKAGIKLHTQLDLRGPIPTVIDITPARMHDVRWLDELIFEAGAFYVARAGLHSAHPPGTAAPGKCSANSLNHFCNPLSINSPTFQTVEDGPNMQPYIPAKFIQRGGVGG